MAGRLNLATKGIPDKWLTGEPQFSYFLMNFRRHTRFAAESIETPFDGTTDFDNILECRIPNNKGDLIRSMMLRFTLTHPSGTNARFNKSIGTRIIDYIDLSIGGQTIQRLTGEYIYMYDQLHNTTDDTNQTLYFLTGHDQYITVGSEFTYNVLIPFYFFRHPSLALPVHALTKQLVEVRVKFKPLKDVSISYSGGTASSPPSNVASTMKNLSLITDFFYITEDERNFMLTRPIEYVITQVQKSQFRMESGESKKAIMVNFKNPVKEMYFIAIKDGGIDEHTKINNVVLKFNNNTVIDADYMMLENEQPLKYHTGYPDTNSRFGLYSFSLKPETYRPTGQVNMSRVSHKLLEMELANSSGNTVRVYAVNYNVLRIESGLGGLKF